ncbi:hemicentin-1-like [Mytilus californianus]|uniref:hemicentin-1-like n=1 Tax=Mytilus californianus TaxID=6549 RepID=UPI0022451CC3|nr:hemicentin-1-like [Mytilus californianus]
MVWIVNFYSWIFLTAAVQSAQLKKQFKYVRIGGTVILKCPFNGLVPVVTWRYNHQVYSMATEINTNIPHHKRLAVVGNHSTGEFFLQIRNITDGDLGTYICVSTSDNKVVDSSMQLMLMVPPSYLSIVGHTSNILHTEEDREVNLTCQVVTGIPSEYLFWKSGNRTFVNGSGEIQFIFQAKRNDHLKVYECIAVHEALRKPLRKTLQLILAEKPRVKIAVYPGTEVEAGVNVTLSCIMGNLFDLRSLTWWKDDIILPFRSTELCITDARNRDAGIYKCSVVNKWGEGYSHVTLIVIENTSHSNGNGVTFTSFSLQWTNTSERYDNDDRQQIPFLQIIASGSSFVILCLLLASTVVIYRRCHGAAHLAPANPNSENRPPNRSYDAEYETIGELQDEIVPNQNVPRGMAVTTIEITTVETVTDNKSSSSSAGDSSSRSLRSLSDYLNPYCSINADLTDKKNEYEFCLYKASYDTSSKREVKKCSNTI